MTRVVGIGGKLRHGKDEIADRLVGSHGWVKIGMSDALAEAMYILNPWILLDTRMGWKNKVSARIAKLFRRPPKPVYVRYQWLVDSVGYVSAKQQSEARRLLQVLGTEIGRKLIDDSVWTNIVIREVNKATQAGAPGVIITGIRFPNELSMIEDLNGETWWVHRPGLPDDANSKHDSENSINAADFDRCVYNSGTLKELYQKVDNLVGE